MFHQLLIVVMIHFQYVMVHGVLPPDTQSQIYREVQLQYNHWIFAIMKMGLGNLQIYLMQLLHLQSFYLQLVILTPLLFLYILALLD